MTTCRWGGGQFIVRDEEPRNTRTPEDFTQEQKALAQKAHIFLESLSCEANEHVDPSTLDSLPSDPLPSNPSTSDPSTSDPQPIQRFKKAAELGLLGAEAPLAYGGLELNKTTATLLSEALSRSPSSLSPLIARAGTGIMPIVYFGTDVQKERWLPSLVNGSLIAVTDGAIMDSGITAAKSNTSDHYILNGSKPNVTNASLADLFIVYAAIDGTQPSAFIVEKGLPGLTIRPKASNTTSPASSTCCPPSYSLVFDNVQIPADHLLGELGMGRKIAIPMANYGRFKLSASCLGGMKEVIQLTASLANERKQLGKPMSFFPIVAAKLADMNMLTYVAESVLYRTAGLIDERSLSLSPASPAETISEYAIECAINKVFLSEALDTIVDEAVQITRGSSEVPEHRIEHLYQEARDNRIHEGTNEVNRLFIPTALVKRALKGEIPLVDKALEVQKELLNPTPLTSITRAPLDKQIALTSALKKAFLMLGGLALQKHGLRLEREQEIVASLADAMIELYVLESAVLRTRKLLTHPAHSGQIQNPMDMTALFAELTFERAWLRGRSLLATLETGENLRVQLAVLRRLLRFEPADLTVLRKRIANRVIAAECYALL